MLSSTFSSLLPLRNNATDSLALHRFGRLHVGGATNLASAMAQLFSDLTR
jgi:hypothetical protein